MNKNIRSAALSGVLWRFLERIGSQGVTFVISVILARMLDPAAYGTVALITVFSTILNVFVDSGMGSALVQKKDADDLDYSSLFYFNLAMCAVLYLGVWFAAPMAAAIYNRPELIPLIRVSSLTLVISGIKNIQVAYVSKNLLFRRFFKATMIGTVCGGAAGVAMAFGGFGVWALVAQGIVSNTVDTVVLWLTVEWRPKLMFSLRRLKGLFSYGWKLLASSLLNTVFSKINDLTIGVLYSAQDLAFYSKGCSLPMMAVTAINGSIDSVLFPVMSAAQSDKETVKALTRRSIRLCSFIMWPVMMGAAACANPLIEVLLTEKWLPCVPYFVIYCIIYAFFPVNLANLNAIKAVGRSDLILKMEIIKKIASLLILICTMRISVMVMSYGFLLSSMLCQVINAWPNAKLLNYNHKEQLSDILPPMLLSVGMGSVVYLITYLPLNPVLMLLLQVPVGAAIYVAGAKLLRMDCFDYLLGILKGLRK